MSLRRVFFGLTTLTLPALAACSGEAPPLPSVPTPPPTVVTANAYILNNAVNRNDWAFGDEPVVIHKGERLRWINVDLLAHVIVADSPDATDFQKTNELVPGAEQSFVMNKLGMTGIHCSIHPNMTGTLIVREP